MKSWNFDTSYATHWDMAHYYHILHHYPALEWYELTREQESLAQQLVQSGLMRIDAFDKCNFVRFSIPENDISLAFSLRQLQDQALIPITQTIIKQCLKRSGIRKIEQQLTNEWNRLQNQLKNLYHISLDQEEKLARLIIQAAHPSVIQLILLEETEIFISFGFEIGDVMDIQNWKTSGKNSGMQSTDGINSAIYISCGGNPFITDKQYATYATDGFQAMARMIIVGGQELGHYADIIRNKRGHKVSRHSADLGGRRAKEPVRIARLEDIGRNNFNQRQLKKFGLNLLCRYDEHQHHYKKHKIRGLRPFLLRLKRFLVRRYFLIRCQNAGFTFIKDLKKEPYLGKQLVMLYHDMQFNLSPRADVYSRESSIEEEAIACIEALARVPQQVNKWGTKATEHYMHGLYRVYYEQVIPACIGTVEQLTGKSYVMTETHQRKPLFLKIKHIFKRPKKPKFSPLIVD